MRITSIEIRQLKIPLVHPFETSSWREEEKTCILVQIGSDGQKGYGECPVTKGPWYGAETVNSAWHVIQEYFVPATLGKDFASPQALLDSIFPMRGNNMARAGFEMAFYDLTARAKGRSLSSILGGTKTKVASGVSVGIRESTGKLVEAVSDYLDQGYQRIKLKIRPGNDLEQVSAVRQHFPERVLTADANGAYDSSDFEALVSLDKYGLQMLEQPFAWDDLLDHANLHRAMQTPICLDESIAGTNDLKAALVLGSCQILNLKPARVGGLTESKKIHDICLSNDMPVWCGGLLETGVGRAHNVAIASLPGFVLPNDISASDRYFGEDIVSPEFKLNPDGTISVPSGPGIGVEVKMEKLEEYTQAKRRFVK